MWTVRLHRTLSPVTPATCIPKSGSGGEEHPGVDGLEDIDADQKHHRGQIEGSRADAYGRNNLSNGTQWRIGDRVDPFAQDGDESRRPPLPRQQLHPVKDEPCQQQDDARKKDKIDDLANKVHRSALDVEAAGSDALLVFVCDEDIFGRQQEHLGGHSVE